MKKKLNEIKRLQKLAGIITENVSNNESEKNIITPEQKKKFLEAINDLIEEEGEEYAFDEAGNILARILTNNEAEFLEDVEKKTKDEAHEVHPARKGPEKATNI